MVGSGHTYSDPAPEEARVSEIIARTLAGDREAFDELVFHYRDHVFQVAWNLTRNHEDAMDVSQESFIRAYRALASYKGRSRFSTWLHRITLNTCVDYVRRERRHRHLSEHDDRDPSENSPSRLDQPQPPTQRDEVYHHQLQAHVLNALQELAVRQKEAFILRYYHDLDTRETAEIMRCSEGAVKRHLHRAQTRLREILRDLVPK